MQKAVKNALAAGVGMLSLALVSPMIAQMPGPPLARSRVEGPQSPGPLTVLNDAAVVPTKIEDVVQRPVDGPVFSTEVSVPQGSPHPLGLADLQAIALSRHPALSEAAARVEVARGRHLQAGLRPNPRIGYLGQEIGNQGTAGVHGLIYSREFITAGKLDLSQASIAAEIRAAEEAWRATELRVLADVRLAFINTLVAQERLQLAEEILRIAEDGFNIANAMVLAEESAPVDRLQARNEANTAGILVDTARAELDATWRRLSVATGGQPLSQGPLAGTLERTVPLFEWQSSLHRLFSESPLLKAADGQIAAARWNLERQAAEPVPNVNLQAAVAHSNMSDNTIANVQMSFEIPVNDANQGAVLAARSALTAAERNRDRIVLSLERRLADVFRQYEAALRQTDWYDREVLGVAKNVLALRTTAYEQLEVDYTAVLTAQKSLFEFKQLYLQALQDAHLAAVRIEFLLLDDAVER
ncbi:MAG: TolC family protein [Pirellulales bacterium]|nr:TolC family protein [Pirellulales bacterium]